MPQGLRLEIACFNAKSATTAAKSGAHRIELCGGTSANGGLTPPIEEIETYKNSIKHIPLHVMIRPRPDDFVYTDEEIKSMCATIEELGARGLADGFVFGVLTRDGHVDVEKNKALLSAAKEKPCTFHRAFDEIPVERMSEAIAQLAELGFAAVLTSGGHRTAFEGASVLQSLVQSASGRLEVIVGGGVRSSNLTALMANTQAMWFHSSALTSTSHNVDENEIKTMLEALKEHDHQSDLSG